MGSACQQGRETEERNGAGDAAGEFGPPAGPLREKSGGAAGKKAKREEQEEREDGPSRES